MNAAVWFKYTIKVETFKLIPVKKEKQNVHFFATIFIWNSMLSETI